MPITAAQRSFSVAVWFISGAALLFASLLFVFFVPYADVVITVRSEPVQTTAEITLDPDISSPLAALDVLPAQVVADDGVAVENSFDERNSPELLRFKTAQASRLLLVKKQELFDLSRKKVNGLLSRGSVLQNGSLSIVVSNVIAAGDDTAAHITLGILGQVVPQNDYQKTLNKLGNHAIDDLEAEIAALPNVQRVMVRPWPSFWPWLPYQNSRIRFSLDIL